MNSTSRSRACARSAVSLAVLLTLAACGGGGGGGSHDNAVVTPSDVGTSVSGVASKGLLKRAVVKAYGVDAHGAQLPTVLASGTTSDTGSYSLTGLPQDAVVVVEVTPGTGTKMADETTGTDIDVPAGFKLRAAKALGAGAQTLQVTPYSDMAVALAERGPGLTKDVVSAANAKVVTAVGQDVLSTEPKFDGRNKPTNAAGASLAAVSRLAAGGSVTGCDDKTLSVNSTSTNALVAAQAQAAKVQCVVAHLSAGGTADKALLDKLELARKSVVDKDYAGSEAVPPVTPSLDNTLPVSTAAASGIAQAKALIASVRATAVALRTDSDAKALPARIKAVGDSVNGAVAPFDNASLALLQVIQGAMATLDDPQAALGSFPTGGRFVRAYVDSTLNVTCQFYSNATFTIPSTSFDNASTYLGCRVSHVYVPPVAGAKSYVIQHAVGLTKLGANSYGVSSALGKQTGSNGSGPFVNDGTPFTSLNGAAPAYKAAKATRTANAAGAFTGVSVIGDLAPGLNFKTNAAVGTLQALNVSLASTATADGNTRLGLVGQITVMDGTTPLTTVQLLDGSYVQAKTAVPGLVFDVLNSNEAALALHLDLGVVTATGAKVHGVLDVSDFTHDAVRWGPRKVAFAGVVTESDDTRLFDGRLDLLWPTDPETGCLGCSAAVIGRVLTTGTQTVELSASVAQSATVRDELTFSGKYVEGSNTLLISGHVLDVAGAAPDKLSLSTPLGVGFTYTAGDLVVPITQGSTTLGVFNRKTSRLIYADSSYEQF